MEFDKRQIRAIFITGIAILFIILLFLIIGILTISKSNNTNKNVNILSGYSSIKELIEHYDCKYKNDTYRENRDYPTEINLVFKEKLYENDSNNEEWFNKIISDVAKFLKYTNFKMIDTENDITIEAVCKDGSISTLTINGIEDYFIYMNSQLEVTKYEEIDTTSLTSNVDALNFLIDNNWSTDVNFGTRESIFKNYYIHFDEGIKYRKIGSSIYNVIFTERFQGTVVNNISVGTSFSSIKQLLGKPAFENEELGVIGYKGKDIYAFFTKDEISIYKNEKYDYKEFWKLVDTFLEEDMDFKTFMNELTYIWKDYSEYSYASDYMFMAFPNRGVEIKLNYDNVSGIILYNNISDNISTAKKYLEHTEFISRLKLDSVFEAEKRRIEELRDFKDECNSIEKEEETKSMLFYSYLEKDLSGDILKVYFPAKTGEYPDRELNETVYSYVWISDNYFVYSIYGEGIYCFDVTTGIKTTVTERGTGNFLIKDFKNDILTYDDQEIILEF